MALRWALDTAKCFKLRYWGTCTYFAIGCRPRQVVLQKAVSRVLSEALQFWEINCILVSASAFAAM